MMKEHIIYLNKEKINEILKIKVQKAKEYENKYEFENALKEMIEIHKIYPDELLPLHYLSELYIRMGKFKEASIVLKKAITISDSNPDTYRFLGYLYTEMQDFDKALEYLNTALYYSSQDTDRGYVYFHIGRIYMKKGDIEEALENLKKAHECLPQDKILENTYKDLSE